MSAPRWVEMEISGGVMGGRCGKWGGDWCQRENAGMRLRLGETACLVEGNYVS